MSAWYVLFFDAMAKRDTISKCLQTMEEAHAFARLLEGCDCAILDILEVPAGSTSRALRSDAFDAALKAVRDRE